MIKNDKYYRDKMIEDIDFIVEHMESETQESLEANPVLMDSMMFRLIQVSENARNLTEEYKEKYPEIPWTAI